MENLKTEQGSSKNRRSAPQEISYEEPKRTLEKRTIKLNEKLADRLKLYNGLQKLLEEFSMDELRQMITIMESENLDASVNNNSLCSISNFNCFKAGCL